MPWLLLAGAIAAELVGTLTLRAVAVAPAWWSVSAVVLAYAVSFFCMGVALRQLNVAVVYAIWSGIGTAAVSVLGVALFGERLSGRAVAGLLLIVLGVVVLVGSGTVRHS